MRRIGRRRFVTVVAERCVMADALTKVVMAESAGADNLLWRLRAAAYVFDSCGWCGLGAAA